MRLLAPVDLDPVVVQKSGGDARFLITCDHAGRTVPAALGDLGLPPREFDRHIAWDIGAGDLSLKLGAAFGATVIRQRYSRLVIDCNRDPARPDAIPGLVDGTTIPGNLGLSQADISARVEAVHTPYHAAIAAELDRREAAGLSTVLLLIHSFTPEMAGHKRPWRFGVLHEGSSAYSRAVLEGLARETGEAVGDNQPYAMDDIDYTAPRHAIARGLEYLELEVRQDLLAEEAGRVEVAALLARVLPRALTAVPG